MSDWISVKDRLPKANGTYLVCYGKHTEEFYGHRVDVEFYAVTTTERNGQIGWFDGPEMVTHWMPLPEPPKDTP